MFEGIMRVSEWVSKLATAHMLWLVSSFPFHIFLYILFESSAPDVRFICYVGMTLFGVLLLMPAVLALFTVVRAWVTGYVDASVWRTFWSGYRESYLQAVQLGGIGVVFFVVSGVALVTYGQMTGWIQPLYLAVLVVLFFGCVAMLYACCFLVHFRCTLREAVSRGALFVFVAPKRSVVTLIVVAIIAHVTISWPGIALFFSGSLIAWIVFWQFHQTVVAIRGKTQERSDLTGEE